MLAVQQHAIEPRISKNFAQSQFAQADHTVYKISPHLAAPLALFRSSLHEFLIDSSGSFYRGADTDRESGDFVLTNLLVSRTLIG